MKVSIITPSFRSSQWLRLCVASVADQAGVETEHIVQDNCSDDGTEEWLPRDPRVTAFIEKDGGMYDAVNRGLRRATGDICAYLNCDEQYLPGALHDVAQYFEQHPAVDVVFADALVTNPDGTLICFRKVVRPIKCHVMVSHLPVLTCATFFRRRIIESPGVFFRTDLRAAADAYWVLELLRLGVNIALLRQFVSAFVEHGDNLGMQPVAAREAAELAASAPLMIRLLRPLIVAHHRLRKLASGCYSQKPFSYSIYTPDRPEQRTKLSAGQPSSLWRSRFKLFR